jgi:hypothetical protein
MVLDDLRHDSVDCASRRSELAHNFGTACIRFEGSFDGIDLTAQPANPIKQFLLVRNRVCHFVLP